MISFDRVSFAFPDAAPIFTDLALHVPRGSFTLLTGPSGSGKSTVLRLAAGLAPFLTGGRAGGSIVVADRSPLALGPGGLRGVVGVVFQNPETQAVLDRVEDEVAFALEEAGVPRQQMRLRVRQALEDTGLTAFRDRRLATLSGGERQRVALAAALALAPQVLLLDEPTSQLDLDGADTILAALAALNRRDGLTILMAEHRVERVARFCDRTIALPPLYPATPPAPLPPLPPPGQELLAVCGLRAGYAGRAVLDGVDFALRAGEVVALRGPNGAGKSTLLRAIVGLIRPSAGSIRREGREIVGMDTGTICRAIAYLPQNPGALLFADTVAEELGITLRNHGLGQLAAARVGPLLERLGIARYAASYPRDLSVGERQRVAIGAVAVTLPRLLLLDEPTRGLDGAAKHALGCLLRGWAADGNAILLVTHDAAFADSIAGRHLRIADGKVTAPDSG